MGRVRGLALVVALGSLSACMASTSASGGAHPNGGASVVLQNLTGRDVCGIFVAPVGGTAFSTELLGVASDRDNMIASNESEDINVRPGTYDVRIQNCDGRTYVQSGADLTGAARVILDPPR